ncbi:hypothetical protein GA0061081_11254 [Gilliamella bombicola]|uniref:Uncharacterized protein n=1 Tax=Gilliamella bombicola TaxID=1798182 RepID=A0A1C4D183_9GAMM|nr:hypothetical protein [Gilliamella bombicola]SCC25132.1 hypothetical protein GA0061081_11254 [Gilliamella bombicola]
MFTSRAIEGSAPYLTFDGGVTKVTTTDTLLAIILPDGTKVTPSTNTSSGINPIILPTGRTLSDIGTLVPSSVGLVSGAYSVSLNDLITQGNWGDDDGDGQGTNGVTATGIISVSFTDKNGRTVNRSDALDICNAPYRVTLNSTGGRLTTQYGVPNSSTFGGSSAVYYINPNESPKICFARPNLLFGGSTGIPSTDQPDYAGPTNIWNPNKGFLVQSTSSSSYGRNFPTTGADGLYFDLDVGGVDASQLTWSPVTQGGITATVSRRLPYSALDVGRDSEGVPYDYWILDKSLYVTRVMLRGPRANSAQINSATPSPLTVPSLPQTFELVGRDSSGRAVVKYGFELRHWFVHRGSKNYIQPNQSSWCRSLGYRLPRVKDLTNAVCGRVWSNPSADYHCESVVGATPSSSGNHYQRRIGAGFFTEWGYMSNYADVGFLHNNKYYWTIDATKTDDASGVESNFGHITGAAASNSNNIFFVVCTTP